MGEKLSLSRDEAQRRWQGLNASLQDIERGVLKLMLHPESTPDQLAEARAVYRAAYESMKAAALKLDSALPPRRLPLLSPNFWEFYSLSGVRVRVTPAQGGSRS